MRIRGVKPSASAVALLLGLLCAVEAAKVNKHKPWIENTYHGIVTENDDKVLLDPPLIALDKDAPLRYAGKILHLLVSYEAVSHFASSCFPDHEEIGHLKVKVLSLFRPFSFLSVLFC
ncbi:calsyntenin-1-like [Carassius auratus]|uniref:Calsyntenin-1-like n=1 Tax=Carassius auratus TaxID=7957 RepID=A0A6P6N4G6_CARAU|nr:calsyntenin-1-like [Carassius auratus]